MICGFNYGKSVRWHVKPTECAVASWSGDTAAATDHLYVMHGLFWVAVAAVAVILGLWPDLIDRLANFTGIYYPPALLLLAGLIVLFVKALHADMLNTRLEREVRRLNQRIAMLEADIGQARPPAGGPPRDPG